MRPPYVPAVVVLAAGVALTAWAVTELRGGIAELPNHWWSSASALLLVLGATATVAAWRSRRAA
jgi:cytochrome bd-type quinol oxidase subunit 2